MKKAYKAIYKKIKQYDNIVVLRHDVPDFDASGTQFGLVTWIKDNFKNKNVYACGKTHKFFSPSLYPATDTEKAINDDILNKKYLLIVVDVANIARVDGKEFVEKADYIIKIDHHPLCDDYGDVVVVKEHAAAAAEIVADMLISFKKKISEKCAYYLYSAIVGDSGRFQYSDTNPTTFKVVSELFKTNFNFTDVYDKMYLKSLDDIRIVNFIYSIYQRSEKGVVYYFVSKEDLKNLNIEREQVKAFVNLFAGYHEVKIWVQFSEEVDPVDEFKWKVSIRSRGVKINDVASKHHGGGHDNASGAKCVDKEEMLQLVKELDELL